MAKSIPRQIASRKNRIKQIDQGSPERFYRERETLEIEIERGYGRLKKLANMERAEAAGYTINPRHRSQLLNVPLTKRVHLCYS